MQKRRLGNSGLDVSDIGLGCMGLSFGLGPAVDKNVGISVIRSAVDRGVTFVPIPGTTKLHRLEENIGGTAVKLTADDLRDIDRAAAEISVEGARYPEHLQKLVGR